jgi:hypothetical protein
MNKLGTLAIAAVLGASALALTATSASAYVVCNRNGTCWHERNSYAYQPAFGVVVHPDNWRWRGGNYRWREHPGGGRGYWRSGVWISF